MKTGIFGGTFDPIHNAHITVANAAMQCCGLDRVLVIPAANPPHKPGAAAPFEDRYRMVELACASYAGLEPSRLEEGKGRSYSIGTVEKVRAIGSANDSLYFIIGADAFAEIRSWHRWQDLIVTVEFIVVTRPAASYEVPVGARVHPLDGLSLPVSSSDIRAAIGCGERPPELAEDVYRYILLHKLYVDGP